MALFSDSELLMIAVILDEEEHEGNQTYKKKLGCLCQDTDGYRMVNVNTFSTTLKDEISEGPVNFTISIRLIFRDP